MKRKLKLNAFEKFGFELEYMIVDRDTLSVKSFADELIKIPSKKYSHCFENKEICWSYELVNHLIELKTNGPAADIRNSEKYFFKNIKQINSLLKKYNAQLLPTAMHPFMNPVNETQIWKRRYRKFYRQYSDTFNCRRHGWANIQSMHINLPFCNNEEFEKLFAAIRLILPIIPALAASSPVVENKITGLMDSRLEFYRKTQTLVPFLTGKIIPEQIFNIKDYKTQILQKIYSSLKPYDEKNIFQFEWMNLRGARARFMRNAIEIRVIDMQESPISDISIAAAVISLTEALFNGFFIEEKKQKQWKTEPLYKILISVIRDADETIIDNNEYLKIFGYPEKKCKLKELWEHIINKLKPDDKTLTEYYPQLKIILESGCLSRRILKMIGSNESHSRILEVYKKLADCLENNKMLVLT